MIFGFEMVFLVASTGAFHDGVARRLVPDC